MEILSLVLYFLLTFPMEASNAFHRRRSSIINERLASIQVTDLNEESLTPPPVLKGNKSTDHFKTTSQAVDYSTEAVARRLEIYLRGCDASAIFCELKGNRSAASLAIFELLAPVMFEILNCPPDHEMFRGKTITPVGLIGSIFTIFINFEADITRAEVFDSFEPLERVIYKLKTHHRPILAFFILLQDYTSISEFGSKESINFYGVSKAIMMLPNYKAKAEIITHLYNTFGSNILDQYKIPKRIFRDAPEIDICRLLTEKGFRPLEYPFLFSKCRLHRNNDKWDYFIEIYGNEPVTAYLESDWYLKPEKSSEPKRNLPFTVCPMRDLNHPRWTLYSLAYGHEFVLASRINS